jgi:hypothetical protein
MTNNRFRRPRSGRVKPRRLRAPKLHVWGRILIHSGRASPTHFWKLIASPLPHSRLSWKPS